MTQQLEALKQALEALETGGLLRKAQAITGVRQAIKTAEQPDRTGMRYYKNDNCSAQSANAPDCICWSFPVHTDHPLRHCPRTCEVCVAEAETQEPVAWQVMVEDEPMKEFSIKEAAHDWAITEERNGSNYSYWIRPLYTAPPKQEWRGLTVRDYHDFLKLSGFDAFKAMETKLKEKNNG